MNTFLEQKSDQRLIDALKAAAQRKLSPEEKQEQAVSFIYGSISDKGITKDKIRQMLGGNTCQR
jgi:hypothetical protein